MKHEEQSDSKTEEAETWEGDPTAQGVNEASDLSSANGEGLKQNQAYY